MKKRPRLLRRAWLSAALCLGIALPSGAGEMLLDDFESRPDQRWRFVADTVMGGVSTGRVQFLREDGASLARLTGSVSTANNGGFIQMRIELPEPPTSATNGIRLIVRGNDQQYFVHLRSTRTRLPWQFYQAAFSVTGEWTEVRLPYSAFQPSGRMLRRVPVAENLRSLGVVAYGRNHTAEIDVLEIGFY